MYVLLFVPLPRSCFSLPSRCVQYTFSKDAGAAIRENVVRAPGPGRYNIHPGVGKQVCYTVLMGCFSRRRSLTCSVYCLYFDRVRVLYFVFEIETKVERETEREGERRGRRGEDSVVPRFSVPSVPARLCGDFAAAPVNLVEIDRGGNNVNHSSRQKRTHAPTVVGETGALPRTRASPPPKITPSSHERTLSQFVSLQKMKRKRERFCRRSGVITAWASGRGTDPICWSRAPPTLGLGNTLSQGRPGNAR